MPMSDWALIQITFRTIPRLVNSAEFIHLVPSAP
jgi:hypothetical protein